ncbi:glycoside hydrolase family 16 protein [Pseudonocardia kujensis]|uniref:glycoside hydrolase family 16 protein n=1 Tax=Pseudonocardia kujensis TaxID=1128675 RepID=UPI001E5539C3|nr:glycoside hydrolase family 16 protein [Pseudonocardia kujensis]MCE0763407.1 glycoside hydrolase family 16 protein [Pseudonocardia kujensis]
MRTSGLVRALAVAVSGAALLTLTACPANASQTGSEVPGAPSSPPSSRGTAAQAAASQCPRTAADTLGWGVPTRQSDFDGTALPPDWHPYGPEPGHDEKGTRTPDAITVANGQVTVSGDEQGTTGAMSWHPGQRYGRWEVCVKSDPGPGGYHPVVLLWPVKEDWPKGGEIDWMEISADDRQTTDFFLHYGADNSQESGSVRHDATEWTAYALEWTPQKMTAYLDGKEWYSTTETGHFPPGAMNMTVQLDLFPPAGGRTAMHLDWAKQWALPESEPAELSLAPGAPATGQPDLHPERTPKPVSALPASPGPGATRPQQGG